MSLASGRTETIVSEEQLARFFNSSKSSRKKAYGIAKNGDLVPKGSLFQPDNYPDLSVSRVSGLTTQETTEVGDLVLEEIEIGSAAGIGRAEEAPRKKVHGAVILTAQVIESQSMEVVPDEPPLHHALILGWAGCRGKSKLPNYAEMKSTRKNQADLLAEKAEVKIIREKDDPVFSS